jgi:hypothetical protein
MQRLTAAAEMSCRLCDVAMTVLKSKIDSGAGKLFEVLRFTIANSGRGRNATGDIGIVQLPIKSVAVAAPGNIWQSFRPLYSGNHVFNAVAMGSFSSW